MRDYRIDNLARILCRYSTSIAAGEVVQISASSLGSYPLVKAVHAEALKAGARLVQVDFEPVELTRQFIDLASDEALDCFPRHRLDFMREVDVYIGIGGSENALTMARADQDKLTARQRLLHPILEERVGSTRWVVTRYPTPAAAQDAGMSLDEYEDFFFAACNLDWEQESAKQEALRNK